MTDTEFKAAIEAARRASDIAEARCMAANRESAEADKHLANLCDAYARAKGKHNA